MIGARIRDARKNLQLTQDDLARRVGTDARTIWRWENEKTDPSGDMLLKLSDELNVTTDFLMGRSDDPMPSDSPLTQDERHILAAVRRGDKLEAIRAIVELKVW
jgi:transcriptional regulator with XRE-family HTH domain